MKKANYPHSRLSICFSYTRNIVVNDITKLNTFYVKNNYSTTKREATFYKKPNSLF